MDAKNQNSLEKRAKVMFIDLTGKKCFKLGLHTHTTLSDGRCTPEEVARMYKEAGYDAIAITDHWKYGPACELAGLTVFSGAEYNLDTGDTAYGGAHIVGLCMTEAPDIRPGCAVQDAINAIHAAGGIAVLAHPAWSLCQVEDMLGWQGIDATEIFNTVSGVHESDRPYSGVMLDLLANRGRIWPMFSSDDTHYYDGTDEVTAAIYLHADTLTRQTFIDAVRRGDFYSAVSRTPGSPRTARPGPEVHLMREGDNIRLICSPASKISFLSNRAWCPDRILRGEHLTEAVYSIKPSERYVRAEVTDSDGLVAYSNYIVIDD